MAKGSIILKILIVLLAFLLVAVIAVPEKIWTEEEMITHTSRYNMNAIYEAEQFFHRKTGEYTENLDTLITVIENDTSLQQRKLLADLTNEVVDIISNVLNVPTVQAVLSISQAASEIQNDLLNNERYFQKYENLDQVQKEIFMNLTRFDSSAAFPRFCEMHTYVDSLNELKDRISQYRLQNAAYFTQNHIDSLTSVLPRLEKNAVADFWNNLHARINRFVNDALKTDINRVTNVIDRLQRFNDRINSSMNIFLKSDLHADREQLSAYQSRMDEIYQKLISSEHFQLTQRFALLELTTVDSVLLNLSPDNFICPDSKERYIVSIDNVGLTIESPNLLDEFAEKNRQIVEPIRDLPLYDSVKDFEDILDSTHNAMTETVPLIRRYGNILLNIKEIQAEMQNLKTLETFLVLKNLRTLTDTIQVEKRISVLEPMIEANWGSMVRFAGKIRNQDINELSEKVEYIGGKIQELDSALSSNAVPSRIRNQVQPFYPVYEPIFQALQGMKNAMNDEVATKIETAARGLRRSVEQVFNGYEEPVYVIFSKKHINHGYIQSGVKSWE